MTENEREKLIRGYAAGEIAWSTLRERGIENYLDVLAGLGALGLRPPMAPMDGPNVAARERGRAALREALRKPQGDDEARERLRDRLARRDPEGLAP